MLPIAKLTFISITILSLLVHCKPYEKIATKNTHIIMTNSRIRLKLADEISPIFSPQRAIFLSIHDHKCAIRHIKTKQFYRATINLEVFIRSWPIQCIQRRYANFHFTELPTTFYYDAIPSKTLINNLHNRSFTFQSYRYGETQLFWRLRPMSYRKKYLNSNSYFLVKAELIIGNKVYWLLKPYYSPSLNHNFSQRKPFYFDKEVTKKFVSDIKNTIEKKTSETKSSYEYLQAETKLLNSRAISKEDFLLILWFWKKKK